VTGEWVEVFPPDGEPADEDEAPLDPGPRPRFASAATGLFGSSLVFVLLGSVLPLFRAIQPVSFGVTSTLSVSAWRFTSANLVPGRAPITHSEPTPVPVGYPLLVVALLLAGAVVLWLRAGWRPSSLRTAKLTGVVAATFLAGLVFAFGMFEIAWQTFNTSSNATLVATAGEGFWALVIAAVAGITAVVLSLRVPTVAAPAPPPGDWGDDDEPAESVPPGQPAEWPVVAVLPADDRTSW
jgi:hypothetical protein